MLCSLYVQFRTSFDRIPRDVCTWLWQAASGVSSSYDAFLDFFDRIGNFLSRFHIYAGIPPTWMMTDIIVKVMAELLSVLGLATKLIEKGQFCKFKGVYLRMAHGSVCCSDVRQEAGGRGRC